MLFPSFSRLVNLTLSTDGRCLKDEGRFLKLLNCASAWKGTPVLATPPKKTGLIVAPSQEKISIFSNDIKRHQKPFQQIINHHMASPIVTIKNLSSMRRASRKQGTRLFVHVCYGHVRAILREKNPKERPKIQR